MPVKLNDKIFVIKIMLRSALASQGVKDPALSLLWLELLLWCRISPCSACGGKSKKKKKKNLVFRQLYLSVTF